MNFLTWLQETDFALFIASDPYAYPVLLCLHAVGMATAVGLVWVMSARALGYPRALSPDTFPGLSRIALWGFALNAASGLLIFITEATRVIVNAEFLIKMACIVIGGVAAWHIARSRLAVSGDGQFPLSAKIVAAAALLAWLLAIVFGRMIAYTIKPPF